MKASRRITPAGEWLLDNFYLIEEQIRAAKRLLPKGYAKGLPRLKDGPSKGLPRVYDIALETVSHGDGRVDPEGLDKLARRRLSDDATLAAGRTMGNSHHAPSGIDRESQAGCNADRHRQDRPEPRRLLGRQNNRDGGNQPEEPDPDSRRHGQVKPADGQFLCCRVYPSPPGTAAPLLRSPYLDRAAALRVVPDDRAVGPIGKPATGGRPAFHEQQHREPALPRRHGLARLRRTDEHRRTDPARRPCRSLWRNGF